MIRKLKNIYHRMRAIFAHIYFGFPAKKLTVLGVTGTDGKTTTCFYLYNILLSAGYKVALISTIEARFGDEVVDVGLHVTSPDAWQLVKLLRRIADNKMEYVIIEVTSHGIDQGRVFGIDFSIAGLTNITPEHLDYHKTFENYQKTKMSFIKKAKKWFITDNIDDSILNGVKVNLPGDYNRLNAKLAVAIATELNISASDIKKGIESLTTLPGRMEVVYSGDFTVIVDFAHTPNGLENALQSARKMVAEGGKLISVFGSASERDESKRPVMGEIAGRLADIVILTAEDPRKESIRKISEEIAQGARSQGNVDGENLFFVDDRAEAIRFAIKEHTSSGDVVIITGKGHERSINYGNGEEPWDEVSLIQDLVDPR